MAKHFDAGACVASLTAYEGSRCVEAGPCVACDVHEGPRPHLRGLDRLAADAALMAAARSDVPVLCDEVERLQRSWDELHAECGRITAGWSRAGSDAVSERERAQKAERERDKALAECDRLAAAYRALEDTTREQLDAKSADLVRLLAESVGGEVRPSMAEIAAAILAAEEAAVIREREACAAAAASCCPGDLASGRLCGGCRACSAETAIRARGRASAP